MVSQSAIDSDICAKIFKDKYFQGCINICKIFKKFYPQKYVALQYFHDVVPHEFIRVTWKTSSRTDIFWDISHASYIPIHSLVINPQTQVITKISYLY